MTRQDALITNKRFFWFREKDSSRDWNIANREQLFGIDHTDLGHLYEYRIAQTPADVGDLLREIKQERDNATAWQNDYERLYDSIYQLVH